MAQFQVPTHLYMAPQVVSVSSTDTLERACQVAIDQDVSSLPVEDGGRLVGIVSLTDLLHVGLREAGSAAQGSALTFPSRAVAEEMTRTVETITPETSLADAAKIMRDKYIHRLFVTRDSKLAGVLSSTDLIRVIEEKKVKHPVGDYMSSPVFTIRGHEPLSEALRRLDRGHASGLIVVEDGWPVGIFSKMQALKARDQPRSMAVSEVMSLKILVLPPTTSLHRAAAQASALGVRRVVIHDGRDVQGILSGLDFARAVM